MNDDSNRALVPASTTAEIVTASGIDQLLSRIRPEWKAKNLIARVKRLIPIDPSSACQRLLNATIHDLRDKIVVAGLDLAKEAADRFRLPSIAKVEDITENYSTARAIDLAYRIGILSRPEWRRIRRCYEIRRDLEHEDDEYEAEIEDIFYIFKSCVDIVLSRDPIELICVDDVKELIDVPKSPVVSQELLEEFQKAPNTRQREILEHLVNTALDSKKADIVRQNAVELLRSFQSISKNPVKIELGQILQERIGKKRLELVVAKVAHAAGVIPYLKQRKVADFFEWIFERLNKVGYQWRHFSEHGEILEDLEDIGGLIACPAEPRAKVVLWMALCYLGEPGSYGTFGRNRPVFYSDMAAPRIREMFKAAGQIIAEDLEAAKKDKRVVAAAHNKAIARRLEALEDLVARVE